MYSGINLQSCSFSAILSQIHCCSWRLNKKCSVAPSIIHNKAFLSYSIWFERKVVLSYIPISRGGISAFSIIMAKKAAKAAGAISSSFTRRQIENMLKRSIKEQEGVVDMIELGGGLALIASFAASASAMLNG